MVNVCTNKFSIQKFYVLPTQRIYVKWMVFGVCYATPSQYLINFSLLCPALGNALVKAGGSRPVIAQARVRSHVIPREFCPSISVSPVSIVPPKLHNQ